MRVRFVFLPDCLLVLFLIKYRDEGVFLKKKKEKKEKKREPK